MCFQVPVKLIDKTGLILHPVESVCSVSDAVDEDEEEEVRKTTCETTNRLFVT